MNHKIEICANSTSSCIEAEKGGAHRIELCAGIPEGGTTPSYGEIVLALESTILPVNVIIRPRGADFLYSRIEIQTMLKDIEMCKNLGVNGVVFGCLTPYGDLHMLYMKELMRAAEGMSVTCHRAFDMCRAPFETMEKLIDLGCDRILTSGQQRSAETGIPLLSQLIEKADDRIIIMPGCGINEKNIAEIAKQTGATELHMSLRKTVEGGMQFRNPNVLMGDAENSEFSYEQTDADRVRQARWALEL
ncbi:MAG: copper homeostasis protein CutC [Bacteroidales bacterium]